MKNKVCFLSAKRNLILFIASFVAQIFVWSINPGTFDLYKYFMCTTACLLLCVFLCGLWKSTQSKERKRLFGHVLLITISFNLIVGITATFFGGVASFLVGICVLFVFIRFFS